MDLLAVVPAKLLFLLNRPAAKGLLKVTVGVLAADHEADLTRRVGGDGGVAVLNVGKDLLASLLEVHDERQVKPLALSYASSQQQFEKAFVQCSSDFGRQKQS